MRAGLQDVKLVSTKDVFAGAEGEASARSFKTMGANIRAVKPQTAALSRVIRYLKCLGQTSRGTFMLSNCDVDAVIKPKFSLYWLLLWVYHCIIAKYYF